MKDTQVLIKLSEDEKTSFKRAAELSGLGFSAWARQKLRQAAKIELSDAGLEIEFLNNKKHSNGESKEN